MTDIPTTVTDVVPALHLASASPRRRDLLAGLGLEFSFGGVDLDETRLAGESPAGMVRRLALAKARAALAGRDDCAILGSDTAVVLGDRVFGKPGSEAEARDMLMALAGRTHDVLTGVALIHRGVEDVGMSRSEVRFREISDREAAAYWNTGEPRDKAGGYAIQGLAGIFVESLRGSYTGIIGLPLFETTRMLARAGIHVL